MIATLLLDFKTFSEMAALRLAHEPQLIIEIARYVEMTEFKPSAVIARQDQVQERPLLLVQGEVIMQRTIKDWEEQKHINRSFNQEGAAAPTQ